MRLLSVPRLAGVLLAAAVAALAAAGPAGDAGIPAFAPIESSWLDAAAFAQWVDGMESPIPDTAAHGGPAAVVWTRQTKLDFRGAKFGPGRAAGARRLRIGFGRELALGSVLVSGGGVLSVLKPGAAYPGNLADDTQWVAASRLAGGTVSDAPVAEGAYGLWVLPPGTVTRALRFTHMPAPGDRELAGVLGGVWLLPERLANMAPQAVVQSRAREDVSARLVDESNNRTWEAWDNGEQGAAAALTPENPEVVTLRWPVPVRVEALCLLWVGFENVEVDTLAGADPLDESAGAWKLAGQQRGMDPLYPLQLGAHWVVLDQTVETRAVRLRITRGPKTPHSHLTGKDRAGKRAWLGEVMAVAPLKAGPLAGLILPKTVEEPPPIPVRFTIPAAGWVTLVIDDAQNMRVRNLASETFFPAGENTAWWDGGDDLLRDPEAARHGVYHVPSRPVAPGNYTVRGLWRQAVKLSYEFSIYNAGTPAWETADKTGCWMTTHTPPTSVAAVPGSKTADGRPLVFIGAFVAEGGHGLQWVREDGVKAGGQGWVGGNWTGAPVLAADNGPRAVEGRLCYAGSVWEGELRLTAKTRALEDKPVCKEKLGAEPRDTKAARPAVLEGFDGGDKIYVMAGLAAHDGILVCSMTRQGELLFVDARTGRVAGRAPVDNPRGVSFDSQGRLLVLSGTRLARYAALDPASPATLSAPVWVVSYGLEDPRHVTTDAQGNFYISDRGRSHQVKVFSPEGVALRSVGRAGAPATGPYDPAHMNSPNGLALDSLGRLWVAEADNYPRRVSVWSAGGALARAFYGPSEYGGGGVLDSQDPARFFYKGMEFKLDWKAGRDELARVFWRPSPLVEGHYGAYSPDTPLYPAARAGARYFTSCYTHTPTGGDSVAFVWRDDGRDARLAAALGDAGAWPVLRTPEFLPLWPAGSKPGKDHPSAGEAAVFAWSDANGDGQPQPGEVRMVSGSCHGMTVMNDLSFVAARFGGSTARFAPAGYSAAGAPQYDPGHPEVLGPAGGSPPSSGGDQALAHESGWAVSLNAPAPFSAYGMGGSLKGQARWSYPSPWPGLHASHEAAVPDRPGMVVGHTRLLGGWVRPPGEAGPMFCVNGNMGNMYLMTADGLFVATLFHDIRTRPNWAAPVAVRGMDVTDVSLHDENFWPSITQTPEGRVYLVDGGRTSLVRVDGLDTTRRLPERPLAVTEGDLVKAREWSARAEAARQKARGTGLLRVAMRSEAPAVDGRLDDWPERTEWAPVDRRGVKANFDSNSKPYEVFAAVCVSGGRLYAAWRTTEKDLLDNSGAEPAALFKTGGCLDVMLGTDPKAKADRSAPVAGDVRLLVTKVKGQLRAVLYRAKVPGTEHPAAFSSPWRTIYLDRVDDVTSQVVFAADGRGAYEISIPLETLGWQPAAGDTVRADLGVLRGASYQTTQRVYWWNKATAITADVPSEAELTPALWGRWRVTAE